MVFYIISTLKSHHRKKMWWLVKCSLPLPHKDNVLEVGVDGYIHLEYLYLYHKNKKINAQWTIGKFQHAIVEESYCGVEETVNALTELAKNGQFDLNQPYFSTTEKLDLFIKKVLETI